MSTKLELKYRSHCGKTDIHAAIWKPDKPVAAIQLAHGLSGNLSRYNELAAALTEDGFVVFGNEHTGHGGSVSDSMPAGSFGGWDNAVADMHTVNRFVRKMYPKLPFFLFGHSMGSFLSRTYISRYSEPLQGCILCGTGQKAHSAYILGCMLTDMDSAVRGRDGSSDVFLDVAMKTYCRKIKDATRGNEWVSRDAELMKQRISEDFTPSAGLFRDMLRGLEYNTRRSTVERTDKKLPILFISGSEDPVGDYGKGVIAAAESYYKAGVSDITLKLYPGARHELLSDLDREQVIRDIRDWLLNRL